jgi:hypothetical protein
MPGITSWISSPVTGRFRALTWIKNPTNIGNMQAIHDIFRIWPTYSAMAKDIGQAPDTVRKWWLKRIPAEHWMATIEAANKLTVTLTPEDLMRLNPPRKVRDPSTYRRRKAHKIRSRGKARKQAISTQSSVQT